MLLAVYYWQGEMTSSDVRAACALQAFKKEHEVSNNGRRSGGTKLSLPYYCNLFLLQVHYRPSDQSGAGQGTFTFHQVSWGELEVGN